MGEMLLAMLSHPSEVQLRAILFDGANVCLETF